MYTTIQQRQKCSKERQRKRGGIQLIDRQQQQVLPGLPVRSCCGFGAPRVGGKGARTSLNRKQKLHLFAGAPQHTLYGTQLYRQSVMQSAERMMQDRRGLLRHYARSSHTDVCSTRVQHSVAAPFVGTVTTKTYAQNAGTFCRDHHYSNIRTKCRHLL